ncbi:TlpA family protein disulfide reductase [Ottowia sp. GY511]|uniref:TlpA family protein disulfide reductase n=1 Tax=Ottowia sp. GY511 TaxID=2603274 RepID=UPI0011CA725A|nr:TlpA disulfide reductase family protein [Ottowia sp. GY511]TXK29752.1 TlpA family protein disulfide reductase [Ottowia sp. GY511]
MNRGVLSRRHLCLAIAAGAVAAPARAQHVAKPWPASRAMPPLVGPDLQGQAWDLAALRGRAVLINFWATWCAPCKEEMPTLQTLAELEGERLAVLAVNVRELLPRVVRYAQSAGLTFAILPDPRGEITRAWDMKVFPTTVLVDGRGRPQRVVSGAVDWTGAAAQDWIAALRG